MPLSWSHSQPAAGDDKIEARFVFGRAALVLKQERAVDQFDVNAIVLQWLKAVRDLHQLARGGFGVGEGARLRVSESSYA